MAEPHAVEPEVGGGVELPPLARRAVTAFHAALLRQGNELVTRPELAAQLARQVRSVLHDVLTKVAPDHPEARQPVNDTDRLNIDIGVDRARRGTHPVQSLRAAAALFDVTLPLLVEELAPADRTATTRISQVLHEAVMARVAVASLAYVAFLMEKLQASRQEERTRISRELHDRVLHAMGLTLQRLDLHRHYVGRDANQAAAKIDQAIESLDDAVRAVRQMSGELRRSVGEDGVERALRTYLEANAPASVRVGFTTTGDVKELPPDIAEELYLIMREAARNALRHARPARLDISLDVTGREILAAVADDGAGFDVNDPSRVHGGLPSMYERAQLLHGTLAISSSPGHGTRVEVRIPVAEVGL